MGQKVIIVIMLFLTACNSGVGAPMLSDSDTPLLTSSVEQTSLIEFESSEQGIAIGYPIDWAIAGGDYMIYIAPNEEDFPWGTDFSLREPSYIVYTMGPYVERGNQRLQIPQPASEIAQAILDTESESEIINPVTSVSINGKDGAIFLAAKGTQYNYLIVLRIAYQKAVVLAAHGPTEKSLEMQSLLNAIALSIRSLEE